MGPSTAGEIERGRELHKKSRKCASHLLKAEVVPFLCNPPSLFLQEWLWTESWVFRSKADSQTLHLSRKSE